MHYTERNVYEGRILLPVRGPTVTSPTPNQGKKMKIKINKLKQIKKGMWIIHCIPTKVFVLFEKMIVFFMPLQ